jgi:uncharacterized membrane protein YeaQ/YmgE (transglycosylase-associated protein family)
VLTYCSLIDQRAAEDGARTWEVIVRIIGWIILGLMLALDVVLVLIGAHAGGYLFKVTGLHLWSVLVAVVGATVVLLAYRTSVAQN